MDTGFLIDKHLELIRFEGAYPIYISRKSLKHFVESRKKEMHVNHTKKEILDKLYFAVDSLMFIYANYDTVESTTLGRLIYAKSFARIQKINIRIVLEPVEDRLEVCSIHFQKHK